MIRRSPFLALFLMTPGLSAQTAAYTPLSSSERLHMYVSDTYGPFAWLRSAGSAGISQWENDPPEWRQGMRGYGYRFGSRMGRFTIEETLELGADVALGEDPRYFRSDKKGFWPRGWYAATHAVIARDRSGRDRPAYGRALAIFTAAGISTLWYPTRYSVVKDGLQFGGLSLASQAGLNLFEEFWPDIRRKLFRRKR